MGNKKQKQIKFRQRKDRHKKRLKLIQKGKDPNEFFYGKYYVGAR